jgi:hypothetical protein
MPNMSARTYGALSLFICLFCFASNAARADLVWHPDTGWRIEGGVLEGVTGREAQNAVELMNKARAAEERDSTRSAIRSYRRVAKKYPSSAYAAEALYRSGKLYLTRKQYFKSFESLHCSMEPAIASGGSFRVFRTAHAPFNISNPLSVMHPTAIMRRWR